MVVVRRGDHFVHVAYIYISGTSVVKRRRRVRFVRATTSTPRSVVRHQRSRVIVRDGIVATPTAVLGRISGARCVAVRWCSVGVEP